ncbi:hypothetical protein C7D73_30915, partial [Klebsiella pneumoniae]
NVEISVPAAISAYLGVTEPAMYGINLKYRFPMPAASRMNVEISVPAAISAYLGVTEPAMYGINLKYRFPM